jgi:hypothetical protein
MRNGHTEAREVLKKKYWEGIDNLFERKPGIHPVNKGVKHNQKHNKTEDGKGFEIAFDYKIANIPECIDINVFYKGKRTHSSLIWIHPKTMANSKFPSARSTNDTENRQGHIHGVFHR